ncbi:MAG TPA: HAMP domain-containing sensor histidine kinase [Rhizomicrobium sp.]|nr:HAMP domain-containing sensor histidine kinase [Rhizomicrobium sp.]
MAQLRALLGPWEIAGLPLPRHVFRNVRLMVPLCIALICGSFAAAAVLSLRLDRAHAVNQATYFEGERAGDLADIVGAALDRLANDGLTFARNPETRPADPALRNIAIFRAGQLTSALKPLSALPPAPTFKGPRTLFAFGPEIGLAFRDDDQTIAVLFDSTALAPKSLLRRAALLSGKGPLASGADWQPAAANQQHGIAGWPLTAVTQTDTDGALVRWRALLPLYIFVILGPAFAGGWLAALFVGTFERHQKAAHALRSLKTVRPIEAKLMVRLANAERAAAEAQRSKSEFIAHMSHELRTPLNAVIGFSEVIAKGLFGPTGNAKYSEYASDIADAGRALHTRIGDILEFANLEAGRYPLEPRTVELAALAGAAVDEHKGRAFSRRIALDIGFAMPVQVMADPLAVKRTLSNLIANALSYTPAGGRVLVDVRLEEGAGVALVRDSGAGFSASERAKAGRAFQRFDRKGHLTGGGMGLAIAMELARRMGGAMRLSSRPGEGSVLEVRLPRAKA